MIPKIRQRVIHLCAIVVIVAPVIVYSHNTGDRLPPRGNAQQEEGLCGDVKRILLGALGMEESPKRVSPHSGDRLYARSSLLNFIESFSQDSENLSYDGNKAYIAPREREIVPASTLLTDDDSDRDDVSAIDGTVDTDEADVDKLLKSAEFQRLFGGRRDDMADTVRRQRKVKDDLRNKRERSDSMVGRWEGKGDRDDLSNRWQGVSLNERIGTAKRYKPPSYDCIALYCSNVIGLERKNCILGNCHNGK